MSLRDTVCGHTKYEGCPPCPCDREVLEAWHNGELIERVSLDYEAAAKALWPYFPKEKRDALQKRLAKKGVDAALGVHDE